jgi:purine-binding chemotaxis protein CheW
MATQHRRPHLVFSLGGDDYVLAVEQVRELVVAAPLTPLPGAPPWVRGIFNLRGSVLPLVDLGVKLGVGRSAATLRTSWVVVELMIDRRRQRLAFETDEVREIVELDEKEVLARPLTGMRIQGECVRGVIPYGERFALVLELEHVLTDGESLAVGGGIAR